VSSENPPGPEHTHCQNCGAELQGSFCHACGQRDFDFHQSFHHFLHEGLETWFHIDRSFLRGFYDLLFRPGRMTREFNEGRRASHVPPLRFYLGVSLLFFLTFRPHSLHFDKLQLTFGDVVVEGNPQAMKPHAPEGSINRAFEESVITSLREPDRLLDRFVHWLPRAMLVCVPLFALLSRGLFRRGPWRYLQHLILAVHLHTFAFLWALFVSGCANLAGLAWPTVALGLSIAGLAYAVFYYFAALRHTLGASRWTTLWKGSVLASGYSLVLITSLAATLVVSLLWA